MPPNDVPDYGKIGATSTTNSASSAKRDIFGLTEEEQQQVVITHRSGVSQGRRRRSSNPETPGASFDPDATVEYDQVGKQVALLSSLFASNRQAYIEYQKALYSAGYYGSTKPALGRYTDTDQKAWNDALLAVARVNATGQGISVEDALSGSSLDEQNGWPDGEQPETKVNQQTDPAAIRVALISAFQQALGRRPTDNELEPFVRRYQIMERNYSELVNSIKDGSTTGNVDVQQPDLGAQAQEYVQQSNPNEVVDYGQLQYLDKFASMIQGG